MANKSAVFIISINPQSRHCFHLIPLLLNCYVNIITKLAASIEIFNLKPTFRLPYIHGLCSSMYSTWRPLVEKFCILLWGEGKERGKEKGAGGDERSS
jgi:hypothetical protein